MVRCPRKWNTLSPRTWAFKASYSFRLDGWSVVWYLCAAIYGHSERQLQEQVRSEAPFHRSWDFWNFGQHATSWLCPTNCFVFESRSQAWPRAKTARYQCYSTQARLRSQCVHPACSDGHACAHDRFFSKGTAESSKCVVKLLCCMWKYHRAYFRAHVVTASYRACILDTVPMSLIYRLIRPISNYCDRLHRRSRSKSEDCGHRQD